MKHPSHFSMGGVTFSPDNKLDLGVTFSQVIDRKKYFTSGKAKKCQHFNMKGIICITKTKNTTIIYHKKQKI